MRSVNRRFLHRVCALGLVLALGGLALVGVRSYRQRLRQQALAQQVARPTAAPATPAPSATPEPYNSPIDFAALQAENPDAYAWIRLDGTQVDNPVLQHAAETDYYLNHTFEGAAGLPGSIYTRNDTPRDFSAFCSLIYGHNMKNGTMFGTLKRFRDPDFFADPAHRTIQIFLPDQTRNYTIFAAVEIGDTLLSALYDFDTEAGRTAFLEMLADAPGQFDPTVDVSPSDTLVALSTCVGGGRDTVRYLVVGVYHEA